MFRTLRSAIRFRKFERNRVTRRLQRCANVADLREIARKRLPGGVFDYIDGGAEDELTMEENCSAFRRVEFRPRVLRDMTDIDPSTTLLGKRVPHPIVLAPTGFTRIADPQGELAVARAAAKAGLPYALSTLGTRSIEEIAEVSDGPKWFQVYVWRDRGLVKEMVDRAADAGYEAICITVDFARLGRRERDVRRGFTLPPQIGLDTIFDGIRHPSWTSNFVRSEPIVFANVTGRDVGDGTDAVALADYVNTQLDPSLTWRDMEWFCEIWDGPVIVKGVQTVEDAVLAADTGVDAIALSNHGGRQLDGSPAPFELIPNVADAIGDRLELICDGGVRRGSDVIKAVALGAHACMVGRPYLYGLAAGGERGVDLVLKQFQEEIERTMALIGSATIDDIGPDAVNAAAHQHAI